jgi:hypothetical protein
MPLSNYEELKAAVGAWSFNRSDLPAGDLVALGEARLNRDLRLRAMETEALVAFAAGARTAELPAGYLAPIALWAEEAAGRRPLRRVVGPIAVSTATASPESRPEFWTIEGEAIGLERPFAAAGQLTLRYLKRLQLSEAAPGNWLLDNHPDAYLAAALVEAALWAADEEQALRWQSRYQAAVDAINSREARSREAPLRTELPAGGANPMTRG